MNKKIKLLIIEDDNDINKLLSEMLLNEGYTVKQSYSGTEGLIYLEQEPWHIVLLDLMLPGKSGEELLGDIRKRMTVPVIIISAKEERSIKIDMLKLGADDFISKPFDIEEVLARIESNLRRYIEFSEYDNGKDIVNYKEISLNKDTREVFVNENNVILTAREFDILNLLINNPKKVFSKSNLFESVWKSEYVCDDNTITVHVSNLRNKLSKFETKYNYIQTIWGIGYKLEK
ncbi:response regulator transcription factor [Clostridium sp. CCUG 7971]|uniref:response regulator transcription factor n=1 Tax=Clostridium sp. CCUG 7971 TaxID=2811414 RepID=UPI001ABAEB7E|nr:response regulator transcription factor [Clostridium sp. CCUG 7971]MBO3445233.1 response regulator transcription factor [Clostridium sp. CCUG 7971]